MGTRAVMKDGRTFWGSIWEWRPLDGYMTLVIDEAIYPDPPERFYFRDLASAVTYGERVGVASPGVPKIEDRDELLRARADGWGGL